LREVFENDQFWKGVWNWLVFAVFGSGQFGKGFWNWSICGRCFETGQFEQNVWNWSVCETYMTPMNMLNVLASN
jgi:hypothetical protein